MLSILAFITYYFHSRCPLPQSDHAVHLQSLWKLVCNKDDGDPTSELIDRFGELLGDHSIEPARRLIEDQNRRALEQSSPMLKSSLALRKTPAATTSE